MNIVGRMTHFAFAHCELPGFIWVAERYGSHAVGSHGATVTFFIMDVQQPPTSMESGSGTIPARHRNP